MRKPFNILQDNMSMESKVRFKLTLKSVIRSMAESMYLKSRIKIRNLESDLIIYIMTRLMVLVPIVVSLGIYITDLILN